MEVLIINLANADARRRKVNRMLESAKMHERATLIDAIDGSGMYESDIEQQATQFCSSFCTPSMIGCFLGHRKAWQHVVDNDLPMAVVLEDDASFSDDLMESISLLLQKHLLILT
jgi:glycosyl transferase family 25